MGVTRVLVEVAHRNSTASTRLVYGCHRDFDEPRLLENPLERASRAIHAAAGRRRDHDLDRLRRLPSLGGQQCCRRKKESDRE
jgi:hypothetical protein